MFTQVDRTFGQNLKELLKSVEMDFNTASSNKCFG
jgi:hypothetical protein